MSCYFGTVALIAIFWSTATVPCQASSANLKPVLKAIDPSQAKTEKPVPAAPPPPPPSPNPLGRITGAPVSLPVKRKSFWPSTDASPPLPPPSTPAISAPAFLPPGVTPSPAATTHPPSGTTGGAFPGEDLIPEFGKELPFDKLAPPQNFQPNSSTFSPGFSTQPPSAGYGAYPPETQISPEEKRVIRLEQMAFGSTYPEHEVIDRVDHLEKEVFGKPDTGNISNRLTKLETKLGGQGAFGQQAIAPPAVPLPEVRDPG